METIRHRVGVKAPAGEVFDAFATADGVRRWWTRHCDGSPDTIAVYFGGDDPAAVFEVVEREPSSRVVWRTVQGPSDWDDTTITFDIRADGDETVVLFTHAGWAEPVEFMHHCSTSWASYLLSCKHSLEGAPAAPWPDNEPISIWG